jgi:hypothetical protein
MNKKQKYYASLSVKEKALIIQRELMHDEKLEKKVEKEVDSFLKRTHLQKNFATKWQT